jgi:hypothetical protein
MLTLKWSATILIDGMITTYAVPKWKSQSVVSK